MKSEGALLLLDIIKSKTDKTIKFVFLSAGQILEFSYINKGDGKDIICAPTQTACDLGCKFCFLSDIKLNVRNLEADEISIAVKFIIKKLGLLKRENPNPVLLISYMGCGEPLLNIHNVIKASCKIRNRMKNSYRVVRFAVASLIPHLSLMEKFIEKMKKTDLKMKFHLSLHSADPMVRKCLMPAAASIKESVDLVEKFVCLTGNSAEMHYVLMRDINDRESDAEKLAALLKDRSIPVKILAYNEKPTAPFKESEKVGEFRARLEKEGITTEFYKPPGWDIGSSCGQFLMDYYLKYNKKTGE